MWKRLNPDWLRATEVFPDLPDLEVVFDEEAGTNNGGRCARCFAYFDPIEIRIGLAPKMIKERAHRQRGVFRHEIGHLVDHVYGREALAEQMDRELSESPEILADEIAEFIYGEPILYDDEAVQSISHGTPERPPHLH